MLSYWEKTVFTKYDVVIIGGGIVGLSTAASLIESDPRLNIAILEKGVFPAGASTKNAGFACFGSLTELISDIDSIGHQACFSLVKQRYNGLQKLISRLGRDSIEYENLGGFELIRKEEEGFLDRLDEVNELLSDFFGEQVFHIKNESITSFGYDKTLVRHMVYNRFEGQLHTGRLMDSLIRYVSKRGVRIYTNTEVTTVKGSSVFVVADDLQSDIEINARSVAICTNAFTRRLIEDLAEPVVPGRGLVIVTKPIPGLRIRGAFHYDQGYYYFRNIDNRVLLGGGRNLDITSETSTEFIINHKILSKLKSDLSEMILPGTPHEIDHTWTGIMAFGGNKKPVVKRHTDQVYIGVRLGGMGVALASQLGIDLANMIMADW